MIVKQGMESLSRPPEEDLGKAKILRTPWIRPPDRLEKETGWNGPYVFTLNSRQVDLFAADANDTFLKFGQDILETSYVTNLAEGSEARELRQVSRVTLLPIRPWR